MCLIIAGMVNNVVLVGHWLMVPDAIKPEKNKLGGVAGSVEAAPRSFMQELTRPCTFFGNMAMFCYFISFKVMFDWSIK
jgi:hypothetical protein